MTKNLGATNLRRRNRKSDPMRDYDALPYTLRAWLAQANLPWSPASACKIWTKSRKEGLTDAAILTRLSRVEAKTQARDRYTLNP